MVLTVGERFHESYLVNGATGCWEWQRLKNQYGYGRFYYNGKVGYGHRYIWERQQGTIPNDQEIDHRCRNRGCVNPGHLELVSHRQNIQRGHAAQAQCRNGHLRLAQGKCQLCRVATDRRFRERNPGYRQRYAN